MIFTRFGSSALCVVLGSEEDATAEEIEVGAAVHLALDQLELVDLAFRLTAALGHRERRFILL